MADCCSAQMSCCCGSSPASLCCSPLPAVKQSHSTCFMYSMFLLLAILVSCLMQTPELQKKMMEHNEDFNTTCVLLGLGHNCKSLVGYVAVYRVGFTMVVFHFVLLILTLGVSTGHGLRAGIHNGYWIFKLLFIIAICFASFYIPSEREFNLVWMYIGMIGGFLFIILQLILLVDFAHSWNSKWIARSNSGNGKPCWKIALHICSILLLILTAGCSFLLYYFYASETWCQTNKILVGSSVALCVLVCLISILPCVRTSNQNSGLLQGSIMSAYIMYLTWMAVTSEPPRRESDSMTLPRPLLDDDENPIYESQMESLRYCQPKYFTQRSEMLSAYIGVAVVMVMAVFASLRTSRQSSHLGIPVNQPQDNTRCCCCCRTKPNAPTAVRGGQKVIYDEAEQVVYSYAFFHFIFCITNLYTMMQITMWYKPRGTLRYFGLNWPSVWVKMASAWTCVFVYLWTLAIPTCIPGRDFSLLTGTLSRRRREGDEEEEEGESLRSPGVKGTRV